MSFAPNIKSALMFGNLVLSKFPTIISSCDDGIKPSLTAENPDLIIFENSFTVTVVFPNISTVLSKSDTINSQTCLCS